jgi:hypothetical protein
MSEFCAMANTLVDRERVYGIVVDCLNGLTDTTHRQGKNRVGLRAADRAIYTAAIVGTL